MENKSHVIVAVSFILVFGIGAVVFFFWLAPGHSGSRRYQIITDQAVGGLNAQAAVQFKGLKAGHVETVDYAPDHPNKVQVVFVVQKQIPITQSTYAQLSAQGITGQKALKLLNPKPNAKPLSTHDDNPARIPLRRGLLSRLEHNGKQDMQKISTLLDRANRLLSKKNQRHLNRAIAQIDTATGRLSTLEKAAQPALAQLPKLAQRMQATLAKIDRLTEKAQKPVAKAGDVEDSVRSLSGSAQDAIRKFNYDTLPKLEGLIDTMQQTANHVDQLTQELQAKPQSLLLGPPKAQPGPGEPGFSQ